MAQIKIGDMAPDFDLPGSGGEQLSLSRFRGSIVVLYFYPKDNTAGCTMEANDFNALQPEFESIGAKLIGMSPDNIKSHDKFRAKHNLVFDLASDENTSVLQAYGVWVEKSMYGRKYMGVERTTLLIDREGRVARIWNKVKVAGHAIEVLEAARTLAA